jgi:hypothetical protein
VKVLATEPESVNVPVPDLVRAIFPVPSVIASVKPDGLAVPLTVRVLVVPVPPLLVIEPPPAPEVKDAISWLKAFRSSTPPLPEEYAIVTAVAVGSALLTPILITPEFPALKTVGPV